MLRTRPQVLIHGAKLKPSQGVGFYSSTVPGSSLKLVATPLAPHQVMCVTVMNGLTYIYTEY